MTIGWDTHTRFRIWYEFFFRVIQSVSEESRGNETSQYKRHFTSFCSREIATPNKSARNDNVVVMRLTARSFDYAQDDNLGETHIQKTASIAGMLAVFL